MVLNNVFGEKVPVMNSAGEVISWSYGPGYSEGHILQD